MFLLQIRQDVVPFELDDHPQQQCFSPKETQHQQAFLDRMFNSLTLLLLINIFSDLCILEKKNTLSLLITIIVLVNC